VKKHRWEWYRGLAFWRPATKACARCGAELRFPRTGPRGGVRYSYRENRALSFREVDVLPPCCPPAPTEAAIAEAADFARRLQS
jgi:hypothetical protein